ncbi:hypothetical protein RhiirA1_470736 [Rhizophagus irregularis]|uniref:Uncharacterized protein n=1 Tax=Rhizophagus irregularis TaxID=588596 RepID=A0A2N0R5K5_9GLOM|nr:hypothetical protein RhiirA1_470736 [Rhizophagus irregularis]
MNRKEEERVGRLNGRINRRNAVLFDESYENDLVESIGESSLGKLIFGYWGIFDLTQESFHGCTEFTQSEINQISQDFSDRVHWSPEPAHKYLQRYFESNCDPSKVVDIEDHAMFKLVETKQQKHSSKNYIWRICVESIDEQLSSIVRSQS